MSSLPDDLRDAIGAISSTRAVRTSLAEVRKPTVRTMLVPVPRTAAVGGQPLRDTELLTWCGEVIRSVLADL